MASGGGICCASDISVYPYLFLLLWGTRRVWPLEAGAGVDMENDATVKTNLERARLWSPSVTVATWLLTLFVTVVI